MAPDAGADRRDSRVDRALGREVAVLAVHLIGARMNVVRELDGLGVGGLGLRRGSRSRFLGGLLRHEGEGSGGRDDRDRAQHP